MAGPGSGSEGLTDCHAHLDAFDFQRIPELAQEWQAAGVRKILTVGMDVDSSQAAVDLSWSAPNISACVGLHPWKVGEQFENESDLEPFGELSSDPQVLAISEVGLDTTHIDTPLETQKQVLAWFVRLAQERFLPLILHLQAPAGELLEVWEQVEGRKPAAAVHSFGGTAEEAGSLLDQGFYLSLGPRSVGLVGDTSLPDEVVASIPERRLLFDSDAYAEFEPFPEVRPAIVAQVAERVAEIRSRPADELADAVATNLTRLVRGQP